MRGSILIGAIALSFGLSFGAFAAEPRNSRDKLSNTEVKACIAEAQADYEYYVARVDGANALLERAIGREKHMARLYQRAVELHKSKAISREYFEQTESDHGDSENGILIARALVAERSAEMRAAEARLTQANEGRCLRLPSH